MKKTKSKQEERKAIFPLKMTKEEISELRDMAFKLGMSGSAYLRFLFIREKVAMQKDNGITGRA